VGGGRDTEAGSDEIYALRLFDQRTELGGREGVGMAGFRNNQQKDLCPGQNAELECPLQRVVIARHAMPAKIRRLRFFKTGIVGNPWSRFSFGVGFTVCVCFDVRIDDAAESVEDGAKLWVFAGGSQKGPVAAVEWVQEVRAQRTAQLSGVSETRRR